MPKGDESLTVLNTRLRSENQKRAELVRRSKELQSELNVVDNRIKSLEKKVNYLMTKSIEVSDHAVVRYQERVRFIPAQEVRSLILNDHFVRIVDTLGPTGEYPISQDESIYAKVSNRKVITIIVKG